MNKAKLLQLPPVAASNDALVEQGGHDPRRSLSKEEYDALFARAMETAQRSIQLLRQIDQLLEDAARQFDRYQQHEQGTILIAFQQSGKMRAPFIYEVRARAEGGFRIFRPSKEGVASWTVAKNWGRWHMNPGAPFKMGLVAISELLEFRVEVVAYLVGRPFKGIRAMENRWKAMYLRVAGALDSMSLAIERDWTKVRKERAAGVRPQRRVKAIVKTQGDA